MSIAQHINFDIVTVAAAVVIVAISATSCTVINVATRAEAATKMQQAGADPLDIPCAIGDGTERYCSLRAAEKGANK
jgi:hypothetical protein